MKVRFWDDDLDRMEVDADFNGNYAPEVVRGFRKVMQVIRNAVDERDFYAMRSLKFEKLSGDREGQYSMRLNRQWRLILTIEKSDPKNTMVVVEIVDYH